MNVSYGLICISDKSKQASSVRACRRCENVSLRQVEGGAASRAGDEEVGRGYGREGGGVGWLAAWIIIVDCVYRGQQVCGVLACVPQPGVCQGQVCHGQVVVRVWAACVDHV